MMRYTWVYDRAGTWWRIPGYMTEQEHDDTCLGIWQSRNMMTYTWVYDRGGTWWYIPGYMTEEEHDDTYLGLRQRRNMMTYTWVYVRGGTWWRIPGYMTEEEHDEVYLGIWQRRNMMMENMSMTARLQSLFCCLVLFFMVSSLPAGTMNEWIFIQANEWMNINSGKCYIYVKEKIKLTSRETILSFSNV